MKTLGLIGGATWHSTIDYYRLINTRVAEKLGGHYSARIILYSYNFHEILETQRKEGSGELARQIVKLSDRLKQMGADALVLCCNTFYEYTDGMEFPLPLIHIADAVAKAVEKDDIREVLLLGTTMTMKGNFYNRNLTKAGIDLQIPDDKDCEIVHSIIYNELSKGLILEESQRKLIDIIERHAKQGVEGVILGCTELPLIIAPDQISIRSYDTTALHARMAAEFALGG